MNKRQDFTSGWLLRPAGCLNTRSPIRKLPGRTLSKRSDLAVPNWLKRKSFWVMLRREPVTIETQSGWREAFAPATGSRIWGGRPHGRKAPITRKGLIEMLDKNVEEEQAP